VLDICVGSGTTCVVSRELGRHSVGLDLSFEYLHEQARPRLGLDKLAEWGETPRLEQAAWEGLPLFEGE